MADKAANRARRETDTGREDRLKAALKANMARRKAQARARAAEGASDEAPEEAQEAESGRKTPDQDM